MPPYCCFLLTSWGCTRARARMAGADRRRRTHAACSQRRDGRARWIKLSMAGSSASHGAAPRIRAPGKQKSFPGSMARTYNNQYPSAHARRVHRLYTTSKKTSERDHEAASTREDAGPEQNMRGCRHLICLSSTLTPYTPEYAACLPTPVASRTQNMMRVWPFHRILGCLVCKKVGELGLSKKTSSSDRGWSPGLKSGGRG